MEWIAPSAAASTRTAWTSSSDVLSAATVEVQIDTLSGSAVIPLHATSISATTMDSWSQTHPRANATSGAALTTGCTSNNISSVGFLTASSATAASATGYVNSSSSTASSSATASTTLLSSHSLLTPPYLVNSSMAYNLSRPSTFPPGPTASAALSPYTGRAHVTTVIRTWLFAVWVASSIILC